MKNIFFLIVIFFLTQISNQNLLQAQKEEEKDIHERLIKQAEIQKEQAEKLRALELIRKTQAQEIESLKLEIEDLKQLAQPEKHVQEKQTLPLTKEEEGLSEEQIQEFSDKLDFLKQSSEDFEQQQMRKTYYSSWTIMGILLIIILFFWFRYRRSEAKKCPNCKGLGYWEGTRRRETCERCFGTGLK